jgi:hypothetical protein
MNKKLLFLLPLFSLFIMGSTVKQEDITVTVGTVDAPVYNMEVDDNHNYLVTESEFLVQKEHDKRKYQYAIKHKINLLEIWYRDYDNIDTILQNIINNLENSVETTAS